MRGCLMAAVWITVMLALMILWNGKGPEVRTFIESGQLCTEYVSGEVSCEVLP